MENTERTTDHVANGIDLATSDITIITLIDTETKTVTSYQIKTYSQLVESVAAEVKAYNESPTLPGRFKHSPPEGLRCTHPGTNGCMPQNQPSGMGGQMVYCPAKCPHKLLCESNQQLSIELLTQILQEQQKLVSLTRLAGQ
jgi:hypothetical protein